MRKLKDELKFPQIVFDGGNGSRWYVLQKFGEETLSFLCKTDPKHCLILKPTEVETLLLATEVAEGQKDNSKIDHAAALRHFFQESRNMEYLQHVPDGGLEELRLTAMFLDNLHSVWNWLQEFSLIPK